MMDEQRLKDAENSIGLIDCPDCEQGRVSREGTFEDGQEYERCETCDGSGMVSRFPDGHALIAEVRRLQQENAVLCNGGELQRCVVNAAYEDKCKAEQQRDAALAERDALQADLAKLRAAVEALHDYETTGAPDYNEWDRYFDAVYAAAREGTIPPLDLLTVLRHAERAAMKAARQEDGR